MNKAYDALLKPVPRALYLLSLHGESLEEGDITLEPEFLLGIMEVNEEIAGIIERVLGRCTLYSKTVFRRICC